MDWDKYRLQKQRVILNHNLLESVGTLYKLMRCSALLSYHRKTSPSLVAVPFPPPVNETAVNLVKAENILQQLLALNFKTKSMSGQLEAAAAACLTSPPQVAVFRHRLDCATAFLFVRILTIL